MTGLTISPRTPGLQWRCLPFHALGADTLYRLLRLRSEVFVVEQNCVFLDMDGLDAQCLHVLGEVVAPTLPASRGSLPPEGAFAPWGGPAALKSLPSSKNSTVPAPT